MLYSEARSIRFNGLTLGQWAPWSERELWLLRRRIRRSEQTCYETTTLIPCRTCVESINFNCLPKVRSVGIGSDALGRPGVAAGPEHRVQWRAWSSKRQTAKKDHPLEGDRSKDDRRLEGGSLCRSSKSQWASLATSHGHKEGTFSLCPMESIPEVLLRSNCTIDRQCLDRDIYDLVPTQGAINLLIGQVGTSRRAVAKKILEDTRVNK